MLDKYNVHAKSFRMARDRYVEQPYHNLKLRLITDRKKDGCIYNILTASEVAALIIGEVDTTSPRDIIMEMLSFIKNNQLKLRVEKYNNLCAPSNESHIEASQKGKRFVLPSSFIGGRRFMDQLYFDGMAICGHVGFPYLFINFTCNPKWPEISKILNHLKLTPSNRPDIIASSIQNQI